MSFRSFNRSDRVSDIIHRELALILQRQFIDDKFRAVTITGVEVSRKLVHAKIYVTLLNEAEVEATITALNQVSKTLRHRLAKTLNLRNTPELHFLHDTSIVTGNRLSALIEKACLSNHNDH